MPNLVQGSRRNQTRRTAAESEEVGAQRHYKVLADLAHELVAPAMERGVTFPYVNPEKNPQSVLKRGPPPGKALREMALIPSKSEELHELLFPDQKVTKIFRPTAIVFKMAQRGGPEAIEFIKNVEGASGDNMLIKIQMHDACYRCGTV